MTPNADSVRRYLGQQVEVYLGDEKLIIRGQLLGFGQGGDFEILCDDGMIHYCWPMLDVSPIDSSDPQC
jgi:hypothetical protein